MNTEIEIEWTVLSYQINNLEGKNIVVKYQTLTTVSNINTDIFRLIKMTPISMFSVLSVELSETVYNQIL